MPMGNALCRGHLPLEVEHGAQDEPSGAPPSPALPRGSSRRVEEMKNTPTTEALKPSAAPPEHPAQEATQTIQQPAPGLAKPQLQSAPFSWTRGELVGVGAFGRVFQALNNRTGELMAVKQVALAKDEALRGRVADHIAALEAEVALLSQLKHENIVQYFGTERSEEALNIFLEYVPGGSIASLLAKFGPLPEAVVRNYTRQILRGLEYLHQRKIMHRDIKGANILVHPEGTIKLADFGASKKIEDLATFGGDAKSIRGTPYWMAPEVIKQTGHGRPADIWSLGCVVIEMLTGKPPWSNFSAPVAAMFQIASSNEPPPLPPNVSEDVRDFLLLCFNRNTHERANATRLLRHPFITAGMPLPPPSAAAAAATAATAAPPPLAGLTPPGLRLTPASPIKEECSPAKPQLASPASAATAGHERQLPPRSPTVAGRPAHAPHHGRSILSDNPTNAGPLSAAASRLASLNGAAYRAALHRDHSHRPPLPAMASAAGLQPLQQAAAAVQPHVAQVQLQAQQQPASFPATLSPSTTGTNSSAASSASPGSCLAAVLAAPAAAGATRSLEYNPMEEPSWLPNMASALQMAGKPGAPRTSSAGGAAMPAIPEQPVASSERGGAPSDKAGSSQATSAAAVQQAGSQHDSIGSTATAASSRINAGGSSGSGNSDSQQPLGVASIEVSLPSVAPSAATELRDTAAQADQPVSPRKQGGRAKLGKRSQEEVAAFSLGEGSQAGAATPPLPLLQGQGAEGGEELPAAGGPADSVRSSKMAKWRDELFAELDRERKEHRAARAGNGSSGAAL